jgi:hypothetical protein
MTALSLLLFAAACVLWVRSHWVYDRALWTHYRREAGGGASADSFELYSYEGWLWVTTGWGRLGRPGNIYWDDYYRQADATGGHRRFELSHQRPEHIQMLFAVNLAPAAATSGRGPARWQSWGQTDPAIPIAQHNFRIGVPFWLMAVLLAILPAWAAVGHIVRWLRRRARLGRGQCTACGYDLRATPERCPECGKAVAA